MKNIMKNKRPTHCCSCGAYIPQEKGIIFYMDSENETFGIPAFGVDGWVTVCEDREECIKRRRQKEKRERMKR